MLGKMVQLVSLVLLVQALGSSSYAAPVKAIIPNDEDTFSFVKNQLNQVDLDSIADGAETEMSIFTLGQTAFDDFKANSNAPIHSREASRYAFDRLQQLVNQLDTRWRRDLVEAVLVGVGDSEFRWML